MMKKILFILYVFPLISMGQQLLQESMVYDGNNRQYIVYVPGSYSAITPAPLLFAFHGGSGFANSFMNNEADFRSIADTAGFILVYPQALADPNDGGSTNWLHKEPTNHKDQFFVEALIDTLSSEYSIDNDRVYICGYSLGGMFSYELACQINNRIAAMSSVAGAAFLGAFTYCNLSHPTAVLSICGTDDDIHPYNDTNGWYFSVADINNYWSSYNNTDLLPLVDQLPDINTLDNSYVERYSWINGDGCVSVEELKINGGGHDWPSPLSFWANQDINANIEIWNFVSKYDINGLINCNSTENQEIDVIESRKLVRLIDLYGRNSREIKNKLLFYIYDDGTVEKQFYFK